MSDQAHVALLRGINVGGRNAVPMKELVTCVSAGDYADVATYIQSGNVLFTTGQSDARAIEVDLEQRIERHFGFRVPVVVRSRVELDATVESAPAGFGGPDHRCDVIFLKHPLTADDAFDALPPPVEGVDQSWKGPAGCLYFARLSAKASKSRLSRITSSPIYPSITIRNWNTTTKLQRLLAETPPDS
ncbi:MAG TPA: DUF1697 domain-containing protein [Aeromicrobium sp.]|nr:DUF1697 domain-containing protein [Aeromicrobium sp.]HKY56532.1 DUF1697 domain-containing protein [Aeromicrobium sp.]